jgi:hypothetical protein
MPRPEAVRGRSPPVEGPGCVGRGLVPGDADHAQGTRVRRERLVGFILYVFSLALGQMMSLDALDVKAVLSYQTTLMC